MTWREKKLASELTGSVKEQDRQPSGTPIVAAQPRSRRRGRGFVLSTFDARRCDDAVGMRGRCSRPTSLKRNVSSKKSRAGRGDVLHRLMPVFPASNRRGFRALPSSRGATRMESRTKERFHSRSH